MLASRILWRGLLGWREPESKLVLPNGQGQSPEASLRNPTLNLNVIEHPPFGGCS